MKAERITKLEWYSLGGFKNPMLWRRQVKGTWQYFINRD